MARVNIRATVSQTLSDGSASATPDGGGAPSVTNAATITAAQTLVAADVAVLVADGATPTQAHVTTLNTNWGTLNTALNATGAAASGNVSVSIDTAVILNSRQLKAALDAVRQYALASGIVLP